MKLPFALNLKFVFRVLLPGLFVALGLLPIMETILQFLHAEAYKEVVFIALSLVAGYLILLLDMPIYMLYEGRRWPRALREYFKRWEADRLSHLLSINDRYLSDEDPRVSDEEYHEAWVEIRQFPLNSEGQPEARFPTRLGNLIAAFEEYPESRYGLEAVFYWPRIWLKLDKDLREEIDNSQAEADSALYSSAAVYFIGVMYLIYLGLRAAGVTGLAGVDAQPLTSLLVISLAAFAGGRLLYRLSLYSQEKFGGLFRAVFDQFHDQIEFPDVVKRVAEITGDKSLPDAPARERREAAWLYMQYYRVRPDGRLSIPVPKAEQEREAKEGD